MSFDFEDFFDFEWTFEQWNFEFQIFNLRTKYSIFVFVVQCTFRSFCFASNLGLNVVGPDADFPPPWKIDKLRIEKVKKKMKNLKFSRAFFFSFWIFTFSIWNFFKFVKKPFPAFDSSIGPPPSPPSFFSPFEPFPLPFPSFFSPSWPF